MYSMFTYIIIITLCLISFYSIYKKKYEFVFVSLYAFLPNFFALDLHPSLPLITAARFGIGFLIFYIFREHLHKPTPQIINKTSFYFLILYFLFRLIPNLYYALSLKESIKTILEISAEEFLFLILFICLFQEKWKIEKALVIFTHFSAFIFLLSIFESIFNWRFSDILFTAKRPLQNAHYIRLGLLRAKATFELPSFYATFCVVLIPIIIYHYLSKQEKRYILFLFLDLYSLLHTGCRAQIMISMLAIFILLWGNKEHVRSISKLYLTTFIFLGIVLLTVSLSSPQLKVYYQGTFKSILNEIGFHYELDTVVSDTQVEYGSNKDGSYSRLAQFSGIRYALNQNLLFGLGADAQNRHVVQYYWRGKWRVSSTFDVGYVAILVCEGLFGFAAYICLAVSIVLLCIKNLSRMNKMFFQVYVIYAMCLFSNDMMVNFFWLITALFYSYQIAENKAKQDNIPPIKH